MVEIRELSTKVANPALFNGLHEGIPEWLKASIWAWIEGCIGTRNNVEKGTMLALERKLRTSFGSPTFKSDLYDELKRRYDLGYRGEAGLNIVQGVLEIQNYSEKGNGRFRALFLESVLMEGSAWKVHFLKTGEARLARRVDATTVKAAKMLANQMDKSTELLSKAWEEVFSRNPDPSNSYRHSVAAIESALWPIINPNDKNATLGNMISALREKPQKWSTAIKYKVHKNLSLNEVETFTNNLQLIWDGHTDRHGTSNPIPPTQKAAEAAVVMAITVIYWARNAGIIMQEKQTK